MSKKNTTPSLYEILISNPSYQSSNGTLRISLLTCILTFVFTSCIYVSYYTTYAAVQQFTVYLATLICFHMFEFYSTILFHYTAGSNAFLLNHSTQYKLAIAACIVE